MGHDFSVRPLFCVLCLVSSRTGFYVGFYRLEEKSRVAEGHELPCRIRGQAPPPRKVFEMNMPRDAIWCILRHNFEKFYSGMLFIF